MQEKPYNVAKNHVKFIQVAHCAYKTGRPDISRAHVYISDRAQRRVGRNQAIVVRFNDDFPAHLYLDASYTSRVRAPPGTQEPALTLYVRLSIAICSELFG